MRFLIDRSFERDTKKLPPEVQRQLKELLAVITKANSIKELSLVKLQGGDNAFRLRMGNYRIGMYLENDSLVLSRVLDRKEIYRHFPRI